MINLILLAAGRSSRFGENKLLYEVEGIPLYRRMVNTAVELKRESKRPIQIIVVTAYEEIEEDLAGDLQMTLVHNGNQEAGISHSIKLGIEAAKARKGDCLMFSVCDQPYLRTVDLLKLTEGFVKSGKGIGVLSFGGILGNPVIFNERYKAELLALTGDRGGKQIVTCHEKDVYCCEVEHSLVLKDLDRKEERGNAHESL